MIQTPKYRRCSALLLTLLVPLMFMAQFVLKPQPAEAGTVPNPASPGSWSVIFNGLVGDKEVNPVHVATLRNGHLLFVQGSGYNKAEFDQNTANPLLKLYKAWVWDPTTAMSTIHEVEMPQDEDLFCGGMTHLPDGRLLFFGGTKNYGQTGSSIGTSNYYQGINSAWVFDESSETFVKTGDMNKARWYPTAVANAAGTPVVTGGLDENAAFTGVNETYNASTGGWTKLNGTQVFPMYPGMVLLPSGTFLYTGTYFGYTKGSPRIWNWTTNGVTNIAGLQAPTSRHQGSTIVNYPYAYVIGGATSPAGTSATGTVSKIDLTNPTSGFKNAPYLGYAGQEFCAVVLQDQSLFVSGGSVNNKTPILKARRLALGGTAWQTLASPSVGRMYHNTCIELPDGRVLTMGTDNINGVKSDADVESRFELYTPWYAQPGVVRPAVIGTDASAMAASCGAASMGYGGSYTVSYTGPSAVTGATLTSLPSNTHGQTEGRTVPVSVVSAGIGKVTVKLPTAWGTLPVGVYQLSLKDSRGVPSPATFVQVDQMAKTMAKTSLRTLAAHAGCCC